MSHRALVVHDERILREALSRRLEDEGFSITEAGDVSAARAALHGASCDLAVVRLSTGDSSGAIVRDLLERWPNVAMVALGSTSEPPLGLRDISRARAVEYVAERASLDAFGDAVQRALLTAAARQSAAEPCGSSVIVGESARMRGVIELIRRVARSAAPTVLLRGESGVGKDLMARVIHNESSRAAKPFVNITCTALPDTLLESELFGHERGAFTDAKAQKRGLFEMAEGGTVFLNEIGDISPGLQAKLLGVLEERRFRRVGGTADLRADVRVIAATHRDLEKAVREGQFREDLYYRLNVIPVVIPPLRDRREDVPALVRRFFASNVREFGLALRGVHADAMEKLQAYDWPGNVRQLRNVMERACLLAAGEEIGEDDIELRSATAEGDGAKRRAIVLPEEGVQLDQVERDLVLQALERARGNQTRAAGLLGISRDRLRYRLKKLGIARHSRLMSPAASDFLRAPIVRSRELRSMHPVA